MLLKVYKVAEQSVVVVELLLVHQLDTDLHGLRDGRQLRCDVDHLLS